MLIEQDNRRSKAEAVALRNTKLKEWDGERKSYGKRGGK